jgi:hypothetical protein
LRLHRARSPFAGSDDAVLEPTHDAIAEADAAARFPELNSAAESAPGFLGQLLQKQRIHRTFEADVEVRDLAFSERDDVHAGEGETFEERGGILLAPAESIERFGEDNIESFVQRGAHQRLEAGPKQCGAGDGVIGELLNDRPSVASRELPAHPKLVRNRCVALVVR